jgi:phosphatidylserine decarboxylase
MKVKKDHVEKHTKKLRNSEILVQENGRKATVLNKDRSVFSVIKVDGGVVVQSTACDYIISKAEKADLLIELKGVDVRRAVEQISATAELWEASGVRAGDIAGLIVCARLPNPRFSTSIQRARHDFQARYKGPLHVVDKNQKYEFERVFSFGGPL